MVTQVRTVRDFMTPHPHTIGVDQSVATAARHMFELGVRHLPVLQGDALVGILSERDVAFIRSLRDGSLDDITVEEAMTAQPYAVHPDTSLAVAVRKMAEQKVGSAVVVDDGRVMGLVTSTDALHILADLLDRGHLYGGRDIRPSEVRRRILDEHRILREMLSEAAQLASRVLQGDEGAGPPLKERVREAYRLILGHLDLEDALLAPALRETDAYGSDRAEGLLEGHRIQRVVFRTALTRIDQGGESAQGLARSVQAIVEDMLRDMEEEEKELLSETLLTDDPIRVSFTG